MRTKLENEIDIEKQGIYKNVLEKINTYGNHYTNLFNVRDKKDVNKIINNYKVMTRDKKELLLKKAEHNSVLLTAFLLHQNLNKQDFDRLIASPLFTKELALLILKRKDIILDYGQADYLRIMATNQSIYEELQAKWSGVTDHDLFAFLENKKPTDVVCPFNNTLMSMIIKNKVLVKNMDYLPLIFCEDENVIKQHYIENDITSLSEDERTAICNNTNLSDKFRKEIFDAGVNFDEILIPTEYMKSEKLNSRLETIFHFKPETPKDESLQNSNISALFESIHNDEYNDFDMHQIMEQSILCINSGMAKPSITGFITECLRKTKNPKLINMIKELDFTKIQKHCIYSSAVENKNCPNDILNNFVMDMFHLSQIDSKSIVSLSPEECEGLMTEQIDCKTLGADTYDYLLLNGDKYLLKRIVSSVYTPIDTLNKILSTEPEPEIQDIVRLNRLVQQCKATKQTQTLILNSFINEINTFELRDVEYYLLEHNLKKTYLGTERIRYNVDKAMKMFKISADKYHSVKNSKLFCIIKKNGEHLPYYQPRWNFNHINELCDKEIETELSKTTTETKKSIQIDLIEMMMNNVSISKPERTKSALIFNEIICLYETIDKYLYAYNILEEAIQNEKENTTKEFKKCESYFDR